MRALLLLLLAFALAPTARADAPCTQREFDGSRFTVCPFDAKKHQARIVWADARGIPYRAFHVYASQNDASRVRFAMNAGMFHVDGSPVGLLRIGGSEIRRLQTADGPGNFHMKPNGVFFVSRNGVGVTTSDAFAKLSGVTDATQSGPMLLIGGKLHPQFQDDGPSRLIRNGVGVSGRTKAYFAISEDPVSFGKFARLFRDEFDCTDALYFDGTVSSLWVPSQNRDDRSVPFGPMVIVSDRAKR